MMGFLYIAVALLSLLSAGQSAPVTDCERLLQPIEIRGRDQLLGRWTLIGEATNIPKSKVLTKMFVQNSWERFSADKQSDVINILQSQKMYGQCVTLTAKMTLGNNTLTMGPPLNGTARLLSTSCSDCLVSASNYSLGQSSYRGVQLLTKRNKVSLAELEEFKKQVECLSLPPPAILNEGEGFCDESAQNPGLTADLSNLDPNILTMVDSLLNSDQGLSTLEDMMKTGLAGLEDD